MHLGNVRSALLGWLWARSQGGAFLLRIEDLDPDRSRPELISGIEDDLQWLGLGWDEEVLKQSERRQIYDAFISRLVDQGRAYPCWCSRAEVARAASAPHVGEEGPVYPGTCRLNPVPKPGRTPAIRFIVDDEVVRFTDAIHGEVAQNVAREVGDFVIRRADGIASYQLAVVVDDAASAVSHVLRGDDLLNSTPRQMLLQRALGFSTPTHAHVPLLMQADGKRLAKRDGASTVSGLKALGWSAERVLGQLAMWSGLGDGRPVSARELIDGFDLSRVSTMATVVET